MRPCPLLRAGSDAYPGASRRFFMKRLAVLSGLLLAGAISMVFARQQPQQGQPAQLEIQKVKDNLYMITGANSGGNTAAFITEKGVVVVDTKYPNYGLASWRRSNRSPPNP